MKKKIVAFAMAVVFSFCTAGLGFAAKLKCEVLEVDLKAEPNTVTMTCKKADKLSPGDKIKVTPAKKKGAIEGC